MGVFNDGEGVSCWGDISPFSLNDISKESDLVELLVFLEFPSDLPIRPFRSMMLLSPGSLVVMTGKTVRGDRGDVGG